MQEEVTLDCYWCEEKFLEDLLVEYRGDSYCAEDCVELSERSDQGSIESPGYGVGQ